MNTDTHFSKVVMEEYDNLFSYEETYLDELVITLINKSGFKENKETRIIDLGGGTGSFDEYLKKHSFWHDFTVSDISETLLNQSKSKGYKTLFLNFNDLSDLKETYDIMIVKGAIHFISNLSEFYSKISAHLSKNGKIYIITRPPLINYPFSERAKKNFADFSKTDDEICKGADPNQYDVNIIKRTYKLSIPQPRWRHMLIKRFFSNFTEEDSLEAEKMPVLENEIVEFDEPLTIIELTRK